MTALLELDGVRVAYRAVLRADTVLDDVSLTIEPGELIGIWGDRRSGKSTLLRIMAGLQAPDSGSVRFGGCDLLTSSASARSALQRREGIALVRERRPERNRRTVDHIALSLLCERATLREARDAAYDALERVGIKGCARLGLRHLSPGELFRVGLAEAVVRLPRLLLIDEPAILRSPSEAQELAALLREIGRDSSMALVIASEDTTALHGVKRMLTIGRGKLREAAEPGVVLPFPQRQTG
jgi:ABC-type ATPase involved in cell division